MNEWRDRLQSLGVFPESLPVFDTDSAPADPTELFGRWFDDAIVAGVSQAHAMSLATASIDGVPSVRTVILKDVTPEGLWFAALRSSPKGADVRANPRAALLFYWRELGRQVRIVGEVGEGDDDSARDDFLARHPDARAAAMVGSQSMPLADPGELRERLVIARERIAADPEVVPEDWATYVVRPQSIEFWQAAAQRQQVRLRYDRAAQGWDRTLLWP